jgi:hypothetical protein
VADITRELKSYEPPRCEMNAVFREDLARVVAEMDREGLIDLLKRIPCTFKLDFTEDCLRSMSLDKLRHIVLSASLHLGKNVAILA